MKRSKRNSLRRIALGLAVAAVIPATAQARPMDVSGSDLRAAHAAMVTGSSVEIPYLSHGTGITAVDFWNYDPQTGKKIANTSPGVAPGELANLWGGSASELAVGSPASDDRPFSRAVSVGAPSAVADDGYTIDVGTGTVGGLVLLLAAGGAALAIHQSRKAKLSPA